MTPKKMKSAANLRKPSTIKRYYLTLNDQEHTTLVDMTKTLGMSKSKIVRHMILKNSGYILCNTVEIMKTLDFLGLEITRIRNIIHPLIHNSKDNVPRESPKKDDASKKDQAIDEYFTIHAKIEQSMRELLKTIKQMK